MANSLFLRQQTEYLTSKIVEVSYPELLFASGRLCPFSNEGGFNETIAYTLFTKEGETALLANGATDIPTVSAYVEKRYAEIYTIANKFEYTTFDLDRASSVGLNLDARMGQVAREVMERDIDLIGYRGRTGARLLGLLNQPNVPLFILPNDGNSNGGVNSTRFRHKTAEQIYRDLVNFVSSIRIDTNGTEVPNKLLLTVEDYEIITALPYPNNSAAGKTVLTFFLETQRASGGVQEIISVPYLSTQTPNGMMVAYRDSDTKLEFFMPQEITLQPVEYANLTYSFPLVARIGGVVVYKPLSIKYANF
jgi:hypothetical protein